MNTLRVICKRDQSFEVRPAIPFCGNIKSLARLNQERTGCGAQDGQGMYLGFPGVSANKECGIHALAFAKFWATSVRE